LLDLQEFPIANVSIYVYKSYTSNVYQLLVLLIAI